MGPTWVEKGSGSESQHVECMTRIARKQGRKMWLEAALKTEKPTRVTSMVIDGGDSFVLLSCYPFFLFIGDSVKCSLDNCLVMFRSADPLDM